MTGRRLRQTSGTPGTTTAVQSIHDAPGSVGQQRTGRHDRCARDGRHSPPGLAGQQRHRQHTGNELHPTGEQDRPRPAARIAKSTPDQPEQVRGGGKDRCDEDDPGDRRVRRVQHQQCDADGGQQHRSRFGRGQLAFRALPARAGAGRSDFG